MKARLVSYVLLGAIAAGAYARSALSAASGAPRARAATAPAAKQRRRQPPPVPSNLPAWPVFASAEGHFTIELPATPREQQQTLTTAVGPIQMHTFMHEFDGGSRAFMISFNDYPAAIVRRGSAQRMLDGARNGAVANVHGSLASETRITLNRHPGRELLINVPAQQAQVRARLYLVGTRLYQTLAIARASAPPAVVAENMRFLNSFRLVP